MRQEEVEAIEETGYKTVCFHSFKYVTARKCSRSVLSKLFTLLPVILSELVAASSKIALQLSQVYSHTNFLFEYYINI